MNSTANDHLRSDKLKWAESAALGRPPTWPPVVLLNYGVVFNTVMNAAIILGSWSCQPLGLKVALSL